ncbi:pyridoxamine 5'-phosphate oxidase family protein [Streptosporangium subroseum]|uniref:pyridoxamine 5'-phosphate oxidase family protein n=1 Tax=Streptosporangium subroseum TaxID=106412 RepID=UPI00343091C5
MTVLADFAQLVAGDHGLCVVSTLRPDGTIRSSLVNAGVLDHPLTGQPVVGFVVRGDTRKLSDLRRRPYAAAVLRTGWQWASAEGPVELIGPDDPVDGLDAEGLSPSPAVRSDWAGPGARPARRSPRTAGEIRSRRSQPSPVPSRRPAGRR